MTALKLFLLGTPRLERDGQRVPLSRRKVMALIAYLTVTRQSHSREALAALLWPDAARASALNSLRRTLSIANDALGGQIGADRELVGLDAEGALWVDVIEVERRSGGCAAHRPAMWSGCDGCLQQMAEAAALYGGDFMAGFALGDSVAFDEWQFFQGEARRREVVRLLELLVTGYRARGAWDAATTAAQRWIAIEPLSESAHRQLMALYAEAGRHAAALRQYQSLARLLDDELGVPPEEESRRLYERIRAQRGAPPASSRGDDAALVSADRHEAATLLLDAWHAALESGDPARIEPLVGALYAFYEQDGWHPEGERAFRLAERHLEALHADEGSEAARLVRVLTARRAIFRLRLGAVAEAQAMLRASLEAAQLHEDEEEIAFALEGLRRVARQLANPGHPSSHRLPPLSAERHASMAGWRATLYPQPTPARHAARFEETAEGYGERAATERAVEADSEGAAPL